MYCNEESTADRLPPFTLHIKIEAYATYEENAPKGNSECAVFCYLRKYVLQQLHFLQWCDLGALNPLQTVQNCKYLVSSSQSCKQKISYSRVVRGQI